MALISAALVSTIGQVPSGRAAAGRSEPLEGPAVRLAVQVVATPVNGATAKVRAEVLHVVHAGQTFSAFLGAGDQGDLGALIGADTADASEGYDYRWEVKVTLSEAATDRLVLRVGWRRVGGNAGWRQETVTLREDEERVLDFVSTTDARSSCANALVRITASVSDRVSDARLFEAELWMKHVAQDGTERTERLTARLRSGDVLPYHFQPLRWNLSGEAVDGASSSNCVEMHVGGTLRGRMREDGRIDVEFQTQRLYHLAEGESRGTGTKKFNLTPGETVAVQLPPAAGDASTSANGTDFSSGSLLPPWLTMEGPRLRVRFGQLFAQHHTTIYLKIRDMR
jgi:hypothetical protein